MTYKVIHYIYCYTNKANNKKYIGQTNDLKRRRKQHIDDSFHQFKGHEIAYQSPFHAAMRKYGVSGFDFEVLAEIDTEDWSEVNKLESEFIKNYHSLSPNGYNLQQQGAANPGKNKTSLSDEAVADIIQRLKNKDQIIDIANDYHLSRAFLSDINNGRCLRQPNEIYPLQQNRITNEEYLQIIHLLKDTNYSMSQIATYMNRNKDTIQKINRGYQKIVRALYQGEFPIRKNSGEGYTLKPVETISGETESKITIDT